MRLHTHSVFHAATRRLRTLHDFTIQTYADRFKSGQEALKDKSRREEMVVIHSPKGDRSYRLDLLTYHARDVFPPLLRSVLLVRLVSAFESFLVDSVSEVAQRDLSPFYTQNKVDLAVGQLLKYLAEGKLVDHLLRGTRRKLTNASIGDVRKFYQAHFEVEIIPSGMPFEVVDEVYDRRHLYVHNDGFVDEAYLHKYSKCGIKLERRAVVDETYFLNALGNFIYVARHVKRLLEQKYPGEAQQWVRHTGDMYATGIPSNLYQIEFEPDSPDDVARLLDPTHPVTGTVSLGGITYWSAHNGKRCRIVIGGDELAVPAYLRELSLLKKAGTLRKLTVTKVSR